MAMFARVCSIPECQKPCFEEQDGVVHSYCSVAHSKEALARAKYASLRSRGRGGRSSPSSEAPRCQLDGCPFTVYVDENTGRVHNFCGRRHADEALAKEGWQPSRGSAAAAAAAAAAETAAASVKGTAQCKVDGCRELVFRDPVTGAESDYCSNRHYVMGKALLNRECIRDGCGRAAWVDDTTGDVLDYCGSRCAGQVGMPHLMGSGECSLPGCVNVNMVHPRSKEEMGYCCENHRLRATQRSLGPNPEPFIDRTFRGGTTSADDFRLSVLTNRHPDYLSRKEQFIEKWEKPFAGAGVSVLRMFKIKVPEDIRRKTADHMGQVGNVQRRFHGTSCSDVCTFFVDLRGGPCGESACKVCNICTHGFMLRHNVGDTARRSLIDLRYGAGLYFSSVSGKANDYAFESEKGMDADIVNRPLADPGLRAIVRYAARSRTDRSGRKVRCMFMANVAVGRAFRTVEGKLNPDENLCPPPGFDSVIGERGPNLNYPEVVVYREEAAVPTHLIVYALQE